MKRDFMNLPREDFSINDEHLWEEFRQGDRDSYKKLYNKYLNDLYNYGYKILPDKSAVADHIQDLFIDLWKYKENLSRVKSIKYYLFRSLRNRIIKEINLNKYIVHDVESECDKTLLVLPFEDNLIAAQTQSESEKRLQKAFSALSTRQKEVINLLFYEKFSYEEVAGIMHINLRSVYTLAWKSLSVLRKELVSLIIAFLSSSF